MDRLEKFVPPKSQETPDFLMFGVATYAHQIEQTDLNRIRNSFESLSADDTEWIKLVHAKLGIRKSLVESITEGVERNSDFLNLLCQQSLPVVFPEPVPLTENPPIERLEALAGRVRSLPLVAARDWSSLSEEREITNRRLRETVSQYIDPQDGPILVPGSSSGRLVYDIASLGYKVVGIEHDPLRVMLMHTILSGQHFSFSPYILDTCNRLKEDEHRILVQVPDVQINHDVLSRISIDANEFVESISSYPDNHFSSIVTSWFIDEPTIELEKVMPEFQRVLKKGGVWINFGPLDYSYMGEKLAVNQTSVQKRSLVELLEVVESSGFEVIEKSQVESSYLAYPTTIMKTVFTCLFFIARKQ